MATGFQGRSMAAWPVDCWAAGAGGHCARDCSDEAGAVRASSLFGGGEGRGVLCFCSVLARGVRPALPLPGPHGAARALASVRFLFSVDDETREQGERGDRWRALLDATCHPSPPLVRTRRPRIHSTTHDLGSG